MRKIFNDVSESVQKQFLAAIDSSDLPALEALVQIHGTELPLHLHLDKNREDGLAHIDLQGTALNIAAYLQKETLAVYLAGQGAFHLPAQYSIENCAGWESFAVMPIEQATSFGMKDLTQALMNGTRPIDWSAASQHDRDDWGGSRPGQIVFTALTGSPKNMEFIGKTGLFRGLVEGVLVRVVEAKPGFDVFIDEKLVCNQATMSAGLLAVREALGLEAAETIDFD